MELQFGKMIIKDNEAKRLEKLGFTVDSLRKAVAQHRSNHNGEPSIYCGTFAKYNEGSICGLWIDLTTFDTHRDFINFCKAIHADEQDPELMFQDFEGFPSCLYSECGLCDEDTFNKIAEYWELCEKYSREAVDTFMDYSDGEIENFEDAFMGEYDSKVAFAEEMAQDLDIDAMMGAFAAYFDYEAYARDLFMGDYYYAENFVFCHC